MNDLAVVNKEQRPVQVLEFSSAQTKLLADTIAKGCDENELRLFLEIAKLKRLDPFSGQIRPVKRWDNDAGAYKMVIQTGIDGYRSTASRTDEMAGIDDAVFNSEEEDHPKWAKVTVYRWSHGEKIPYAATARWSEYVQKKKDGTPNSMWLRMPYLMLAKCAEALALRKAFPDELAGVYTDEEMGQADNIIEGQPEPQQKELKPPVAMPTSTEKKTTNGQSEFKKLTVTGAITGRKEGKENALWVTLGDKLLAIPADKAGLHPYGVGDKLTIEVIEKAGKNTEMFYILQSVESYTAAPVEDVLPPIPDGTAPRKEPDAMDQAIAAGKFDDEPIGTLEETRTGKFGRKREIRLQTLMGKNKDKNHGLTWDDVHSILNNMEPPIPHVSDLEYSDASWKMWERLMVGEEDWRKLLPD